MVRQAVPALIFKKNSNRRNLRNHGKTCFMLKVWLPIVMLALRAFGPGLGATEKVVLPLPIPILPDVIVSQP